MIAWTIWAWGNIVERNKILGPHTAGFGKCIGHWFGGWGVVGSWFLSLGDKCGVATLN